MCSVKSEKYFSFNEKLKRKVPTFHFTFQFLLKKKASDQSIYSSEITDLIDEVKYQVSLSPLLHLRNSASIFDIFHYIFFKTEKPKNVRGFRKAQNYHYSINYVEKNDFVFLCVLDRQKYINLKLLQRALK